MKNKILIICVIFLSIFTLIVSPVITRAAGATESDFIGNYSCGNTAEGNVGIKFHQSLPKFTNALYDILKIATPVIIIITGMLDILKAVSAQKEDEIKKAQQKFLKRLLAGAVVFLVFIIIELVINIVIPADSDNALDCVKCLLTDYKACQQVK